MSGDDDNAARDVTAGRRYRVTRREDIQAIFADARSARDGCLTVLARVNGLPHARCAVGVSKRHGSAVRRNRVRRLCREAFRLSRADIPAGSDYMLLPKPGAVLTLARLQESIRRLAPRAALPGDRARGGRRG